MTPTQFSKLMDRMDEIAKGLDSRIKRLEAWAAGAAAGVGVITFLIANDMIRVTKG